MKSSNNKNLFLEQEASKHPYLNRFFQRLSNRDDLLASLTGRHLSPRYFSLGKKRKPDVDDSRSGVREVNRDIMIHVSVRAKKNFGGFRDDLLRDECEMDSFSFKCKSKKKKKEKKKQKKKKTEDNVEKEIKSNKIVGEIQERTKKNKSEENVVRRGNFRR